MLERAPFPAPLSSRAARVALAAAVFLATFAVRTWGISDRFWLAWDQIRDWSIALGPFKSLPLVGPPTHVGGYTIGPAFYWILWLTRVVLGPWFENLPHAGGIGQAALQSGADALLLVAVWKRTGSASLALGAVAILALAPYDLALSATIWNPIMGSILAKAATALILLGWPDRSLGHVAAATAVAWAAVQCYTGVIFVALSVLVALVVTPLIRGDRRTAWRRAPVVVGVVFLLQAPYLAHRLWGEAAHGGMGAVAESIRRVASGADRWRLGESVSTYVGAVTIIEIYPWQTRAVGFILAVCALAVGVRYRRDPALLAVTILPPLMALAGYAFWIGDLQGYYYYYFSLMPASVLTVLLGATALLRGRAARAASVGLCAAALAIAPARARAASTLHRFPEYGNLVRASRVLVRDGRPLRAIEADFLPRPNDPAFVFTILGGRIVRYAPWVAVIARDGQVSYRPAQPP